MSARLHGAAPRLDRAVPGVSPQIAAIVARCLDRDPDARYADMHALIGDLDNPAGVNTAILERVAAEPSGPKFWHRPFVVPVGIGVLLLLVIIAIAFGLQALR
jgi:hypothetical protein